MEQTGIKQTKRSTYFYPDLTALLLGIGILLVLILTANRCVGVYDEWYYCTLPQRLFHGQLMIRDDWTLSQFVFLLNVIPFRIYTAITGGTEGLILFMRYWFISLNGLFYAFVYIKLRKYRFWGVAAAALFCALIPQTVTKCPARGSRRKAPTLISRRTQALRRFFVLRLLK